MTTRFKIAFCFVAIAAICSFQSCKKSFINKVSNDPNSVTGAPISLLLPSCELSVVLLHGMELSWYSSVFMQQQAGVNREMAAADKYSVQASDMNRQWNSIYATGLGNLQVIISKAEADSAWAYAGISRILTAMAIGQLTDCYGDIPYSNAFKGSANTTPAYDRQEQVYDTIQQLLSEGIADLGRTSSLTPSSDDIIYGGDLTLWISTAHILKARYYNHLSKVDPVGSATNALAAIDSGIYTDPSQDADGIFGATATESNPWYQFVNVRSDVRMGQFFIALLDSMNDPRLTVYAQPDASNNYSGSPAGNPDLNASLMGGLYASTDSRVPMVTYMEAKFIEAEAALRTGDNARAATAHNTAILASLNVAGVTDVNFINNYASETSSTITLQKIMTQKYIALYTQTEVWSDYRRTGVPSLLPAANNLTGNIIPRRLIYPSDEQNYNGKNVPQGITLTSHVWWDK